MAKIKDDPELYLLDYRERIKKIELSLYYGKTQHFGSEYENRITDKGYAINIGFDSYTIKDEEFTKEDLKFLVPVVKITVASDNFFKRMFGQTIDLFVQLEDYDANSFLNSPDELNDWIDFFIDNYILRFEEITERSETLFTSKTLYNN